jgi:hypothetical protein
MEHLDPQAGAALEYWFWTFHAGGLAFLVDVIVRRRNGTAETRVSLWRDGSGRVEHAPSAGWSVASERVTTEHADLTPSGSRGAVADIEWDLHWERGSRVVAPLPHALARRSPFDLSIETWPDSVFTGQVRLGGTTYPVDRVPGSFVHYWGRRLADQWLWVSATQFDDPARRVELDISRQRLWGRIPLPFALAFAWIADADGAELVVSGMRGLIRHRRRGSAWEIDLVSLRGRRHRIVVEGGTAAPNDLGEGITQTLLGNLVVDGVSASAATVGVETRGWPFRVTAVARE